MAYESTKVKEVVERAVSHQWSIPEFHIPDNFWDAAQVQPAWERGKKAWSSLISRFRSVGVLSNDTMPTEAALVTLIALTDKFPSEPFEACYYWFLQASRFGRYSGSGTTSPDEDLRDVNEATTLTEGTQRMLRRFPYDTPLEADIHSTPAAQFENWLLARAGRLANAGNDYLAKLKTAS